MNIVVLGAAGFIGTNLAIELSKNDKDKITLVDINEEYFAAIKDLKLQNTKLCVTDLYDEGNFDEMFCNQDIVYHLVSTTVPSNSNQHIAEELSTNVIYTAKLLDACVRNKIKKIVFISSGGTVYGKEGKCPIDENTATYPITAYGLQKVSIEKLLYLYNYMYDLDYRVIRLANPYGPYQRPNGVLGAITTFTYKALLNEEISVYGDGEVVRDFIYIEDAVKGILNISNMEGRFKIYNLGCGVGTSINEILETISQVLDIDLKITYLPGRAVDVPTNYLDITRYNNDFGELNPLGLEEGIKRTADFMRQRYKI